jgi:hypothetical protein
LNTIESDPQQDGLVGSKEAWKQVFPTGAMAFRTWEKYITAHAIPKVKIGGKNYFHIPTVLKHLHKKFGQKAFEV